MPKRVLDVGNCVPDHAAIRTMLARQFQADVAQTHGPEDTLELLARERFDLILVNRKLDRDYSDGLPIIEAIKADPKTAAVPVMLITNYAEHQQAAVAAGAAYGFGKKELYADETQARLAKILG
ncbi:MAG: response regulator [Pirellulaceae bacterium]|nr:response regulator [Pirellulaceae bacterium]